MREGTPPLRPPRLNPRYFSSLCLVAGALLLGIYLVPTVYGAAMSRLAIAQFRAQVASQREWNSARILAWRRSLEVALPAPEAVLRIPRLQLEVPVLEGVDGLTLNRAAGHVPGTALPGDAGNLAIAGHRDGFFRGLKDIQLSDSIEVDRPGATDRYMVRSIDIVPPSDTTSLRPTTGRTLTLITCYPFHFVGAAPQRFIVRAELISTLGTTRKL